MTSDAAAGENLFRGMQAEQDFYRDLTTFYQLDKATVSYQTWKSEEMSFSVRCVPN